jgi:IS5 family transposase
VLDPDKPEELKKYFVANKRGQNKRRQSRLIKPQLSNALHAPEVECIAKGKAKIPYEFGVKVSIVTTLKEGLVVGMRSMPDNPYDGHTLYEALEQTEIVADVKPEMVFVDRGYRGAEIDGVQIWKSGQRRGVTRGLKAMIKRRSAIEPTIGHMKSDGRLDRNWLKGAIGDALHAVLCGAGHNLRLIMKKLRLFYAEILLQIGSAIETISIGLFAIPAKI